MNQYIKCGGLLEGQRRRDVDLVKLEREGEEGGGDEGSVQMKLHRLLFDTVTTSFRSEREMKGRRWRNREKDQRTATSQSQLHGNVGVGFDIWYSERGKRGSKNLCLHRFAIKGCKLRNEHDLVYYISYPYILITINFCVSVSFSVKRPCVQPFLHLGVSTVGIQSSISVNSSNDFLPFLFVCFSFCFHAVNIQSARLSLWVFLHWLSVCSFLDSKRRKDTSSTSFYIFCLALWLALFLSH